jgi:hypothetical protein
MNLLSAQLNETLDKNLTINLHSMKQFNSFTVVVTSALPVVPSRLLSKPRHLARGVS